MAVNGAFQAGGKTYQIVTNAATPTNLTVNSDSPCNQYRLVNHATQPVYVWISPGANPTNVALPTGSGAYAHVVPPSSQTVVTGPQISSTTSVRLSAIAESGTPEIYITPGEGM